MAVIHETHRRHSSPSHAIKPLCTSTKRQALYGQRCPSYFPSSLREKKEACRYCVFLPSGMFASARRTWRRLNLVPSNHQDILITQSARRAFIHESITAILQSMSKQDLQRFEQEKDMLVRFLAYRRRRYGSDNVDELATRIRTRYDPTSETTKACPGVLNYS